MIVEDILLATSALTLSPRKDSSGCILSVSTCKSDRSNQLLPFAPSRRQNGASAIPYPRDFSLIKPSVVPALSTLIGSARRVGSDPKMPRGVKRPSAGLEDVQDSLTSKATSASAKPAKPADNHASRAYEPIVISDDSDSDLDPGPAQKHPSALFAQTLSSKFTYHSPTKARPQRKTISTKSNSEVLQPTASSARLPITLSSSSSSLPAAAAKTHSPFVKEDTSASTSTSPNDPSVPVRKKPKTSKAAPHAAMQLKKTIERAKEAGVSPLDLSPVSAAGFRLLSRCSFCAQAFTKAAAPKVKQQHMAFCAALSKIASTETAVSLIADDVRSALERDEADKRKVRDDRTMLQDVVQEADIVMHEGRASQIAASPKKRGKDAVITKKAIKRSTKLPLFVSEQHSDTHASASHAKHKLLPAREAMAAARDIANQLIGSSIPLAMHSSKVEQDDESNGKTEAVHEPSRTSFEDAVLITPKKRKERSFTPVDDVSHAQKDGNRDASKILSDLSLEQVLASISPASPEKKSPVKALQVSRQRQASREQDMSLGIDGARHSLGSPSHLSSSSPGSSLPRTQAFGPSKLAQRQQASAGPKLFGAETTSRSLLDLVSDKRETDSSPTRGEAKRKVIDTDVQDIDAKRQKSTALDSDMDVDDQTVDTALSAQPGDLHHSTTGKLQDHEPSPSHTEPLATREKVTSQNIDTKTSPRLEQAAAEEPETSRSMLRDGSDEKTAEFDAESIEEDDDDEDAQSYLELLEPLEPPPDPIISQTCSLSESSFDDEVDGPDASEIAYRSRRMLIASGGGSITLDYRRKTGRAEASSRTSRETVFPACSQNQARYRSVSNSDPELLLVTDDSYSSSPQP